MDDDNAGASLLPDSVYDLKLAFIQSKADVRCLQEALNTKNVELTAAQKVKDAEVRAAVNEEARKAAEERAEHIKRETNAKVQEAVAAALALKDKDMEIMQLRMQLTRYKDRAATDGGRGRKRSREPPLAAGGGGGGPPPLVSSTDDDEDETGARGDGAASFSTDEEEIVDGVPPPPPPLGRPSVVGCAPPPPPPRPNGGGQTAGSSFVLRLFKLVPAKWSDEDLKGCCFVALSDDGPAAAALSPAGTAGRRLGNGGVIASFADGINPSSYGPHAKHRMFGFCYRGAPISKAALEHAGRIEAAFGVESGGMQFVCVSLTSRCRFPMRSAPTLPYDLLPRTTALELVPGLGHHVSVYKRGVRTSDRILEVLLDPSLDKWAWRSG